MCIGMCISITPSIPHFDTTFGTTRTMYHLDTTLGTTAWFLNVISAIRHLKVPVNLEDMFEVYMKTRDINVEFVSNYLRANTH